MWYMEEKGKGFVGRGGGRDGVGGGGLVGVGVAKAEGD